MKYVFGHGFFIHLFTLIAWYFPFIALSQVQDFENPFNIANHPEEFLPGWSANEVRSTSSRVFQATGEGRSGSKALAVQAISSFNGLVFFKTSTSHFENPKLAFFAKTKANGSGNRPILLFVSFSKDGIDFQSQIQIGDESTFPNGNTDYSLYEVPLPEEFQQQNEVWIRWEIRFGPGNGTAARFFMDDAGIFESSEEIDPIKISNVHIHNPFEVAIDFNKEIFLPDKSQIALTNNKLLDLTFPADSSLILVFENPLEHNQELSLNQIKSKDGNTNSSLTYRVINESIQFGNPLILNPKTIQLSFSQFFAPESVSQTANFKINGKPPVNIEIQDDGYTIFLELASPLRVGEQITIEGSNIPNLHGVSNSETLLAEFLYLDFLEHLIVLDENNLKLVSILPFNKSELDHSGFAMDDFPQYTFKLSLQNPYELILYTDISFEEGVHYQLNIPNWRSDRGFTVHASMKEFIFDITPPELIDITSLGQRKLLLIFSEDIDPVFASVVGNYSIGNTQPLEVFVSGHRVLLKTDFDLIEGEKYALEIQSTFDLNGNQTASIQKEFTVGEPIPIAFKDIILNEVMPAPRPNNSLPNVEYVELFNAGTRPVYLGGMQLGNSRRITVLPSAILDPGEYIILSPRNQSPQFEKYGKVLGLSNWPTLLNTADQVKLFDKEDNVIDSLNYTQQTYGSSALASGGYSLEIVNPFLKCYLPSNIRPSTDPERGTPGRTNSVFEDIPDRKPPLFIGSDILSEQTVLLQFDKILNQDLRNVQIEIKPFLELLEVEIGPSPDQIILHLQDPVKTNTQYYVEINGLRDCSGNLFEGKKNETYFILPDEAVQGDVVINEVLFNPRTGAPKFVEIYNSSHKFINLKDWKLANLNASDEVANRRILFSENKILEPFSFLVFTTDAEKLFQEYPKGKKERFVAYNSLPSYPISAGNVVFLNPDESITETFSYTERMHHPLLRDKRGVSLERLSPKAPIDDPNNWQSASSTEGYASPGYRNSHHFEGNQNLTLEIIPKVFIPEAAGEQPFTTISYKMESAGKIATLRILSPSGVLIKELCQNAIWGESGFYLWDGTDQNSRKVRPGYYIVWLEIFDLHGQVSHIRKTVVVGTKFHR
ncbi:lamin tail domain-containing protein [Arthrospiribacter ruber]|uniref:Lamin tail domain-containing protein n=1 Tax=Arthrospiribacter ruber TaxID=2487934 RepID=A0A951MAA0_9BACT|nr:lamin tail domain-containing protein [Arthrospiribacter ruber]MBW3467801.1 lamin tail domain-containing protein [Arthrospiribacter ruber]